jgi:hypothetical protein
MANELNIALAESGKTITAKRYQAGAAVGSPITLTEISASGFYTGNMTGSAGTYFVVFNDGLENVGSGSIVWDGTAEVATSTLTAPQIRSELSVELGRLDATISSRLAPSGTLATVTTLTNAPTVPTAAAIADEVRVELATELARLDAPVSGATAPSAATVASAVRSELSTELARVDQAISTRLASSAYTAPSNSDVTAIKAKTDLLETTRLAQCSTVATTGAQLAAALS